MLAKITLTRIGNQKTTYTETILQESLLRLDTESVLSIELGETIAETIRRKNGLIDEGEIITKVRKHHSFQQWFDVIEFYGRGDCLLGYYCNVATPLEKIEGEFFLQDLVLDLWIYPNGILIELDWDEYEEAVEHKLLSSEHQHKAIETMRWMIAEARKGIFPYQFIQNICKEGKHD